MTGFFTAQTTVLTLDDEGNTVTIKRPTVAERSNAMGIGFSISTDQNLQQLRIQTEMLKVIIVGWGGPAFEGRELSDENIEALPSWLSDHLADLSSPFLNPLMDAEKKASTAPTN